MLEFDVFPVLELLLISSLAISHFRSCKLISIDLLLLIYLFALQILSKLKRMQFKHSQQSVGLVVARK